MHFIFKTYGTLLFVFVIFIIDVAQNVPILIGDFALCGFHLLAFQVNNFSYLKMFYKLAKLLPQERLLFLFTDFGN